MATNNVNSQATAQPSLQILCVEDSPDDFELAVQTLESAQLNIDATRVVSRELFESTVTEKSYDVILADYKLPGWTGMEAIEILKDRGKDTPLILVTGALGEEKAVQCIKAGAADLILKTRLAELPAAVCRAISDRSIHETRKRAEDSLRDSEARFRALADSIASAVLIYQGTECRYANRAAQTQTGYTESELMALSSYDLIHPDSRTLVIERGLSRVRNTQGSVRYETKILTKLGEVRMWDVTLGRIEFEGHAAGLITALDVTESKAAEAAREHGGYRDSLTGLLSSPQVQNIFLGEAKRSHRTGRAFALLLLRLDELKHINEKSGLSEGSRSLCKLAGILGQVCRTADAPARNSDDEFVIVLPETSAAGARRLIQRIAERTNNQGDALPLAVSTGIALFPQDGPTFEYVLRSAKRTLKKIESGVTKEFVHSA